MSDPFHYNAPQDPYGTQQPTPGSRMSPADERTWSGLAHFSGLVGLVIGFSFVGPLVVMLLKGGDSPKVRWNAVESLNFQISYFIYFVVSALSIVILFGFVLVPAVLVAWLIFTIIGGVKAMNGEDYKYPLILRLVN